MSFSIRFEKLFERGTAESQVSWMNQFESEALRVAIGLFIVFSIAFGLLRRKLAFWSSLPKAVMVVCLGWFACSLIVVTTLRTSFFQGPIFLFAYFAVVLLTPPLLAVGMLELVLGTYASFMSADRAASFPARLHFIAALSTVACIGAYIYLSALPK